MWHYTILQKTLEFWLLKSMSIYWVQNFLTERRSNKFNFTYSKQVYFLHSVFQISTMSCSVSSVPTVSSENLKNYIHAIIMAWFLWAHAVHIISGKDSQEQCFLFLLELIKFVPNQCIIADIFFQKIQSENEPLCYLTPMLWMLFWMTGKVIQSFSCFGKRNPFPY